jgi:hypothetical protein
MNAVVLLIPINQMEFIVFIVTSLTEEVSNGSETLKRPLSFM